MLPDHNTGVWRRRPGLEYGGAEMSSARPRLLRLASLFLCLTPGWHAACGSPTASTSDTDAGTGTSTAASSGGPGTTAPTSSVTGVMTSEASSSGDAPTTGDGTSGGDEPEALDLQCPGDPSGKCDPDPNATLEAGAAVLSTVPDCFETWVDLDNDFSYKKGNDTLNDCGCDRLCPGDEGYLGPDDFEGDGKLHAAWMAGFGNGRPAAGVRGEGVGLPGVGEGDGLWARGVVLKKGNTTVAIVALDAVGWFNGDVLAVRQLLVDEGLDVDHLIVHATHTHEGPDTMGLWGEELFQSGYDPLYRAQLRNTVASVVAASFKDMRPVANLRVGEVDISDYHENGVANVISDHRDPWIVDETLAAAQLLDADDQPIATLINYGCHPETVADENLLITSDFVHALRRTVEKGSVWESAPGVPGVGGPVIYLNGAVGGMMTTLGVNVVNPNGDSFQSAGFEKADSIGQLLGEMALDALKNADDVPNPELRVLSKGFRLPVVNKSFQFLFMNGTVEREVFLNETTMAQEIASEMALVELGPIHMLTIPGELLPELAIGGYDGSRINAPGVPLIEDGNVNPPDVSKAPEGPYIKERMQSTYPWLIGLANDELGYIIPQYNFELAASNPWVEEAEGDHYEETNSLGPDMAMFIDKYADLLIYWAAKR